jgi:hypothetical protein
MPHFLLLPPEFTSRSLPRYFTAAQGVLCPFGYGQGGPGTNGPIIQGNGIAIFKNPANGVKTLVLSFSATNGAPISFPNAIKFGINTDGSALYNPTTSPMFLNALGMDGARFLNPARPGDLYISSFQFNAPFIQFATDADAKVAVQVVQFTAAQLNVNVAVPLPAAGGVPTLKYCSPSAGPMVDKAVVAAGQAPLQSSLQIKLYNSADCNPATTYSTVSDPAALNLASGVTNPISIPYTTNACNNYMSGSSTPRSFKMLCLAGQASNGIYGATTYIFKDYASSASCAADSPTVPINTGGAFTNLVAGT